MSKLPDIGEVLDDTYKLLEVMGTGGFGAVYRARQLNLDRDVALKVLDVGGRKVEQRTKRFRREVMAIRNLSHPNTVRIFDFQERDDGLLYYTMEALEGISLKELLLEDGPMTPRRVWRIIRQVLKSLAEAHAQGIIHRDLKPANVMLVEMHGETDFVKVLDFGIAKMLQDRSPEGEPVEELTSAGIMVGTPRYMAPEQILGENLGPHTDLYGLGLLTVKLLTEQGVFGDTSRDELVRHQLSDKPIEVPEAVAQSPLGSIMARCMVKEPEQRYQTAEEVLEALDELSESELEDEPLYLRDGKGGWIPQKGSDTTVEPFQGMKTTSYEAVDTPSSDAPDPDPTPEPRPTVAEETGPTETSENVPEPDSGSTSGDGGGSLSRLIAVGGVAVLLGAMSAVGVWMVLGDEGEPADDELPGQAVAEPVADESDDQADQPAEAGAEEGLEPSAEDESEIHEVAVADEDVEAPGEGMDTGPAPSDSEDEPEAVESEPEEEMVAAQEPEDDIPTDPGEGEEDVSEENEEADSVEEDTEDEPVEEEAEPEAEPEDDGWVDVPTGEDEEEEAEDDEEVPLF